ncbi:MAG TPA: hypothetical protein VES20_22245 [Bryobacteraceae bacterium]|nr:hypothetical protein [Bryobacteraceae bacterium]
MPPATPSSLAPLARAETRIHKHWRAPGELRILKADKLADNGRGVWAGFREGCEGILDFRGIEEVPGNVNAREQQQCRAVVRLVGQHFPEQLERLARVP